MSPVDPTAATNPFASLGLSTPTGTSTTPNGKGGDEALGLSAQNFMQLLLAQVQNQSPLNPMDSTAFLGQLAQLSTVSGVQQLNSNFNTLSSALSSNQAVQAANLVGHAVEVKANTVQWDGKAAVEGGIVLPTASGKVAVTIADASGAIVKTLPLGAQPAGTAHFAWDGTDADGDTVPTGAYQLIATATDDDETTALQTLTTAVIRGVGLGGANGLTLELAGVGTVPLSDVQRIQ